MVKIRNRSNVDLEVPSAGVVVAAGATVELDDDLGAGLLEQVDVWELPSGSSAAEALEALTKEQLLDLAAARGVEVSRTATKADVIAAIQKG